MIRIDILNSDELNHFAFGMNRAFEKRSNDRIPFSATTVKELVNCLNNHNIYLGLYRDAKMIGGLMVQFYRPEIALLRHIWIDIDYQGEGYGSELLRQVESFLARRGVCYLRLSVANCYIPAVKLYENFGFKRVAIYANEPNTYYFIDMIKAIPPFQYSEARRLAQYFISKIKFILLFDKYSNPSILWRLIYERREK